MPHKLFIAARQKFKIRNAFDSNISTDIKLSEAQFSKIIQAGRFLGALLQKFAGPLMNIFVPLAKKVFAPLATMGSTSVIGGATHEIMKSLDNSDASIDGVNETVKIEIKK